MSGDIFQIALTGMQRGMQGVSEKAEKITRAFLPESTEDPTTALVGIKLDEFQYKASAKLVKTAEELSDSALEIIA